MSNLNFHLDFSSRGKMGTSEEVELMMENIDYYRRLRGWNRNRVYLMGAASMIGKDNPSVVMQIADYIAGPPPKGPKSKKKGDNDER